jgi:hypothetical protein
MTSVSGADGCKSLSKSVLWIDDSAEEGLLAAVGSSESAKRYVKIDENRAPGSTTRADFCKRGVLLLHPDPAGTERNITHQGFLFNQSSGTIQSRLCPGALYHCLNMDAGEGSVAHGGPCNGATAAGWKRQYE